MFFSSTAEKLFEGCPLGCVITRCKMFVQPNLMAQCSHESSVERMKNLLHYHLPSGNAKGTITDNTGSRIANIALTDLKFVSMIFTLNR